ncbi:MAG: hypothetical protein Unbinned1190contig1000_29 [Prokaryotic dsDNA virus sp.]|nr:MAG: hypothetical protein Unbinned1190contig1000_29 [Prokaryotic dsDNA virus sp.]|tara:strand:+ start:6308 stop:7027 length:720 start_codon:yes stop_codon:yes gene_type:complete
MSKKGYLRDFWPNTVTELETAQHFEDLQVSTLAADTSWGRRQIIKISVAWARMELELRRLRNQNPRRKDIVSSFWRRTESIKSIWHYLFIAEYQGDPINIAQMSREIDVDRAHITKVLKEARELGLCTPDNYLSEECIKYKLDASMAVAAIPQSRLYRHLCYIFFINLYAIRDAHLLKMPNYASEGSPTDTYLNSVLNGRFWDIFNPPGGILDLADIDDVNVSRNQHIFNDGINGRRDV